MIFPLSLDSGQTTVAASTGAALVTDARTRALGYLINSQEIIQTWWRVEPGLFGRHAERLAQKNIGVV